jgi:sodium transport system permease protein
MKRIGVIFRKEMKDMLRDRRTLFFMIVMPFIAIFLVFNVMFRLGMEMESRSRDKIVRVSVISAAPLQEFLDVLSASGNVEVLPSIADGEVSAMVESGQLDFVIRFAGDFEDRVARESTGSVDVYYLGSVSENEGALIRIQDALDEYGRLLLGHRLEERGLSLPFVSPLRVNTRDISSARARIGDRVGGMLPYFIVLFSFLGAMYPAIDLAAGEKERGTMETLLVSPATRGEIVIAKFLVVTLSGLFTAVASFLWLYVVLRTGGPLPAALLEGVAGIIEPRAVLQFFFLLIPLCALFSSLLLSASVFAKSFKEAQSIITPLNFMVIIPLMIGIFPGVKLNAATALIPVLNISLASKEIIAGSISAVYMAEIFLVQSILAGAGLTFCTRWFKREEVIFRS